MQENGSSKNRRYFPCNIIDECYQLGALQSKKVPVFYAAFLLRGSLDCEIIKSALHASLELYDKLNCVLTQKAPSWKRWFQLVWEPRQATSSDVLQSGTPRDFSLVLDQEPHGLCSFLYQQTIDLSKEPGIKVFFISDKVETLLVFALHHAITDGRGAINFVETFIAEYNGIYFNRKTENRKGKSFTYFDDLYLPTWKENLRLAKPFVSVLRQQYGSHREPVAKILPNEQILPAVRMVIGQKIAGEKLEKVMAFAKEQSVMFYDMLLAGLYFTVRKWNKQLGEKETGRIVFYTTVGLRQRDSLSLGNFVSGIHIDFPATEPMSKVELLRAIAKKRIFLLANRAHLVPLSLLSVLKFFPLLLRRRLLGMILQRMRFGRGRQRATMRVTNLGALEVSHHHGSMESIVGDARLERVYTFPADIDTVPSLLFLACEKTIYLNLAVLTSMFTFESGSEFLSLLIQELSNV